MEQDLLPTEVIVTSPQENLGKIQLDWVPQPGNHLALKGKTYTVLERHHHYQYKIGGYCLQKISLYVQVAQISNEKTFIDGRWVVGDAQCRFNARSELIRCAVNPDGPCQDCRFFESLPWEQK